MTVVQPNSIAGINSISVQSGNSLSIHKSDGTLIREIVASTGISTYSSISVGSATTTNNANKSINIGLGASIAQHDVNTLTFGTNGDPRATINSSGDVIIGSTSSTSVSAGGPTPLQVKGSDGYTGASLIRTSAAGAQLQFAAGSSGTNIDNNDGLGYIKFFGYHTNGYDEYARITAEVDGTNGDGDAPGAIVFFTTNDGASSPTERLRIDSAGHFVQGGGSSRAVVGSTPRLVQVEALTAAAGFSAARNSADALGPYISLAKSRGTSLGAVTVVQSGDHLGTIKFGGADGTDIASTAAEILAEVDGTPGSNDMPGRLVFQTTADGASSPTERLRIDKEGSVRLMTANAMLKWTASSGNDPFVRSIGSGQQSLEFNTGGSERLRITSGGHIIAGGQGSAIAFNNVGNDSFGSVIEIDGSHTTDHHGMLSIVGKSDTDTYVAGRVQFINSQNSSGSSGSNAGSKNIAAIEGRITTSDSNAGDDSGGYLRFVTKAEAGGNAEAMRITSTGRIGIGDDNPTVHVSIKGTSPKIKFIDSDATGTPESLVDGSGGDIIIDVDKDDEKGASLFAIKTDGSERVRVTSTGLFGIGNNSPNCRLSVKDTTEFTAYGNLTPSVGDCMLQLYNNPANETALDHATMQFGINGGTHNRVNTISAVAESASNRKLAFTFCTDSGSNRNERMRITGDGQLLVGHTSVIDHNTWDPAIEVAGLDANGSSIGLTRFGNNASAPTFLFGKSRNGAKGIHTVVADDDVLGNIAFIGSDGTDFAEAGWIRCRVDGAPGNNDMPGALLFGTSADGSQSATERMRIQSNGGVGINGGANRTFHVYPNTSGGNIGVCAMENIMAGNSATMLFLSTYRDSSASEYFCQFNRDQNNDGDGAAAVFYVATNGNVKNANNSYGSISDIKLKENIVDAGSQWDDIKNIKVRNFNFKSHPSEKLLGVVAQEVETVSAGLVEETPDKDITKLGDEGTTTKSVKYSVLYMKAVKALQEAMARIETLETKVAALESS